MTTDKQLGVPAAFHQRFAERFGADEATRLEEALVHEPSPISIRLNRKKVRLRADHHYKPVPWCHDALYVGGVDGAEERPLFAADPLWHAGAYYVQEASSMVVEQWVADESDRLKVNGKADQTIWLDLCAAPGGKSTLLANNLPTGALLVTNEPDRLRAKVLQENMVRWGCDNVVVTQSFPDALAQSGLQADLILIDAPCSGEGMFRKEPQAVELWSEEKVTDLATLQQTIIATACDMLKPGGVLIYSTCTFNREENEAHLDRLLEQGFVRIEQPMPQEVVEKERGVYHFFPHRVKGEGFTVFAVRKKEGGAIGKAASFRMANSIEKLTKQLNTKGVHILQAGVDGPVIKGKDEVPSHSMAMSKLVQTGGYKITELDAEQALKYLKRESIVLPPNKGIEAVAYHGVVLGWVKNIGNRANNLYPKGWAIRNQAFGVEDMPAFDQILESNV